MALGKVKLFSCPLDEHQPQKLWIILVGDTVLGASWEFPTLALHSFMSTFESKAVVQNMKASQLSGAVLISDLSLEKSILM